MEEQQKSTQMDPVMIDTIPMDLEQSEMCFEDSVKAKEQYGEITNEFPYIDWVRVINVSTSASFFLTVLE